MPVLQAVSLPHPSGICPPSSAVSSPHLLPPPLPSQALSSPSYPKHRPLSAPGELPPPWPLPYRRPSEPRVKLVEWTPQSTWRRMCTIGWGAGLGCASSQRSQGGQGVPEEWQLAGSSRGRGRPRSSSSSEGVLPGWRMTSTGTVAQWLQWLRGKVKDLPASWSVCWTGRRGVLARDGSWLVRFVCALGHVPRAHCRQLPATTAASWQAAT